MEIIKRGASDCINKQYLSKLPSAITRAVHEADEHFRRKRAEEALEEIKKGNGKLYDADAVNACLAVFEEGFAFPA